MANPEHLALVRLGRDAFNALRDEISGGKIDLSRLNLSGMDLSGYNLSEANLERAHLRLANIQGANLRRANMQGTDLQGANIQDANLEGARLHFARIWGANSQRANLIVGAQDVRGYQSLLTYDRDSGKIDIQFGCQRWHSFDDAGAHFGPDYRSFGNPEECRLILDNLEARYKLRMRQEANQRPLSIWGPTPTTDNNEAHP